MRSSLTSTLLSLSLVISLHAIGITDPLAVSADYYFSRHEFAQAFDLWKRYRQLHPESLHATLRVAELKLMFESREAASKDLQKYIQTTGQILSADNKRHLKEKLYVITSTFLTEDGQSSYFRALQREKREDLSGALAFLQQASPLEKGNILVLKAKGRVERLLKMPERSYQSLAAARTLYPYDSDLQDSLFELQIYLGASADLLASLRSRSAVALPLTARQKLALAVAQADVGDPAVALASFQDLVQKEKQLSVHPIVYFYLGKLAAARSPRSPEVTHFLERYKLAMARPESAIIDGWDPYRTLERADVAETLLLEAKPKASGERF
jgi:hypothetical protein